MPAHNRGMLVVWLVLLSFLQLPEKLNLPGATNVTRVDAAVMCGGATKAEAFPEIKKLGFTSVINLRRDGEPGVDVAAARRAATASGLRYLHVPADPTNPSAHTVDAFLAAVTSADNQPMYIHCGSANRVAAMWMIKRVVVDTWEEAKTIGLTSPSLEKFALDYLESRKR
jgi:uncharacterized protein (TIGR01244 family)